MPLSLITTTSLDDQRQTIQDTATMLPSPTLTNPDMILPYETERESSTPSPPFNSMRLPYVHPQSPSNGTPHVHNTTERSNAFAMMAKPLENLRIDSPSSSRNHWSTNHETHPPLYNTRDIQYNNKEYITPGNAPASESRWRSGGYEGRDADSHSDPSSTVSADSEVLRQLPGIENQGINSKDPAIFKVEQEGDRDAVREEGKWVGSERFEMDKERIIMGAIVEEEEEGGEEEGARENQKSDADDDFSSAILSKEAERILENAKKRLTNMEGNLSRARTSLRMSPSPSPLPGAIAMHGGLSRPGSKAESRAQTSLAGALLRQRVSQGASTSNSSHSRGLSDIYVPSFQTKASITDAKRPFRSLSALGSTNASGFGASDPSLVEGRSGRQLSSRTLVSAYNHTPATPPPVGNLFHPNSPSAANGRPQTPVSTQGNPENSASSQEMQTSPSMDVYNAVSQSSPSSHVHSQTPMEGLHGKMEDLKSKISTLKERTNEDSTQRRSLQSLRTPSPFTASEEQWYVNSADYPGQIVHAESKIEVGCSEEHVEQKREGETGHEVTDNKSTFSINENAADSFHTSNGHQFIAKSEKSHEDSDRSSSPNSDIDRDALAEILREPLDSPELLAEELLGEFPAVPPVSETMRHEDRIDAFDYEHFILHSVLGNYSNVRARPQSYSSAESVETTRPPSQTDVRLSLSKQGRHTRTNSVDSNSTSATFATATEGGGYSDDSDDDGTFYNGNQGDGTNLTDDLQFRQQYPVSSQQSQYYQPQHDYMANDLWNGDSPTYPSFASDSAPSTPRAARTSNRASSGWSPTPRAQAFPFSADSFIESIISSTANTEPQMQLPDSVRFYEEDAKLVELFIQRFKHVGMELLHVSNSDQQSNETTPLLRRRLDTARRALEGEFDVETDD